MKTVRLIQVDSFTRRPLTGNPAGVVLGADILTVDEMKAIARELNHSETAFILSPTASDHDIWIRFFTPTVEVPSCGHATLAAHYARAVLEGVGEGRVRHKIGAGLLHADLERRDGDFFVSVTQRRPAFATPYPAELVEFLLSALGISPHDIVSGLPIQLVDTGHPKVMVPIRSRALLDRLAPRLDGLCAFHELAENAGIFVFTMADPDPGITIHARMFAPNIGIAEDPVTGNGHGPAGAYLVTHGAIGASGHASFVGRQGEAMGRPGDVEVHVENDAEGVAGVRVGGHAAIVFDTRLTLPA